MEVKPGYKQTEVGVIPEEWEVRDLSDVSRKITDGDHVTPIRTSHGYYLLSARNVLNGRIDVSDVDYVGFAEYQRMKQRCGPEAGDILISCSGTIGRVTVVPVGFECVLVRSAALAKIDPELADGTFLQFWLQGSKAQWQIASSVNQGAQPNLFLNHIERLLCPQPPLPEQRAIATALSDVDGLLGGLDRLIAKKRDLKQAAMQQLLTGQTRLPGFHGEWEVSSVGREFEVKLGKMLDAEKNVGVPKPYLGNSAVQWDRIEVSDIATVPMSRADMERFRLRKGDLLVCEGGEVGRAAIWEAQIDECYYQKALHRLRPLRGFNSRFMAALLRLWAERGLLANYVTQTSIAHLPREKFIQIPLPVPPAAEQTAIASVLSEMDGELAVLEQRREKTRALKQAMMQELLTGRTRLV